MYTYDDVTVFSRILAQSRFISRRHIRYTRTDVKVLICPVCHCISSPPHDHLVFIISDNIKGTVGAFRPYRGYFIIVRGYSAPLKQHRESQCTLPEDLIKISPLLDHQEGSKAIASRIDKEDRGLRKSIHQC